MHRQIIPIPNCAAYLSYRPADTVISPLSGDFNLNETALVIGSNFIILSGDFRQEAEKIIHAHRKNALAHLNHFFTEKSKEWSSSWASEGGRAAWAASRC